MQILNLKARRSDGPESDAAEAQPADAKLGPARATAVARPAGAGAKLHDEQQIERQLVEIALLNARVQHLELVVETARSLMSSNQAKLLQRLYEVPVEISELSAQLNRLVPRAAE